MTNQLESSPISDDLLTPDNVGNLKKIANSFGKTDCDLTKKTVRFICQMAWRQNNEDLHELGVTRLWLRMFISKLFCNRANVPAGDGIIEKALNI